MNHHMYILTIINLSYKQEIVVIVCFTLHTLLGNLVTLPTMLDFLYMLAHPKTTSYLDTRMNPTSSSCMWH
jgi:hypothetical protein